MMSVDCTTFETLLADAVGGELNDRDRAAFDSHMSVCDTCRAEYQSMVETIETVRERLSADTSTVARAQSTDRAPRRRPWIFVRYAAAIAIAFFAGYGIRGSSAGPASPGTTRTQAGAITVEEQLVIAHHRAPKASAFTKSVLAVLGTPARSSR